MNNGISVSEQETTVNFGRQDDRMDIYTTDQTMITKLLSRVGENKSKSKAGYLLVRKDTINGRIVGIEVTAPKTFLTLRSKKPERKPMTEEQKKAAADRLRKARNHGNE